MITAHNLPARLWRSIRPSRHTYARRPSHITRPLDSVYRERTTNPSALTRIVPGSLFGPSGTLCWTMAMKLCARQSALWAASPSSNSPPGQTRESFGCGIRPIRNTHAQTRRNPFRYIRNMALRLAENPFRSIRNTALNPADFSFGRSGTQSSIPRQHRLSHPPLRSQHDHFATRPSLPSYSSLARPRAIRPIRNSTAQNPAKAFRSIRNTEPQSRRNPIRSIKNTLGLSGTEPRMIKNESSDYQERILGLSGTPPLRNPALTLQRSALTGGLTFLTPLTSLTGPASQSRAPRTLSLSVVSWRRGWEPQYPSRRPHLIRSTKPRALIPNSSSHNSANTSTKPHDP